VQAVCTSRSILLLACLCLVCESCDLGPSVGDADVQRVDADGDSFPAAADCDDANPEVHPGAEERCNESDDDCDGQIDEDLEDLEAAWYPDADGDGHGNAHREQVACVAPEGYIANAGDCDDRNAAVHPGATELCNGLDDDCDGVVDPDSSADARVWYRDLDADDWGDERFSRITCYRPGGFSSSSGDCDDARPEVHPFAPESCNGVDDDCDGEADEELPSDARLWHPDGDGDGFGDPEVGEFSCLAPSSWVEDGMDCDDTVAQVHPGAEERCNGVDDDCDGLTDEPDAADASTWYRDLDGDGFGSSTVALLACSPPRGFILSGGDCDDGDPRVNPDAVERCDDLDNDCDGEVDEADATDALLWHPDLDRDGFGSLALTRRACAAPAGHVADGSDCDDVHASRHPGAAESWFDGVDSDCDGFEDPDACEELPPSAAIPSDVGCAVTPEHGAMDVEVEWSMSSFGEYHVSRDILMTPVVGVLLDDNGDGVLDERDTVDIAVVTHDAMSASLDGVLRVIAGDGRAVHRSMSGISLGGSTWHPFRYSQLALGDIDVDGLPEIVGIATNGLTCHAAAWRPAGELAWVHSAISLGCRSHAPSIADLDEDGVPEVVVGRLVLHGDGTLVGLGGGGSGYYSLLANGGHHAAVADLDGDGQQEIAAGRTLYDAKGATICSMSASALDDGYTAVADLDGDGEGEIVVTGNGFLRVYTRDCGLIAARSVDGGCPGGPATIADLDGDGEPEIAVAGSDRFNVYGADLSLLWSAPSTDPSCATASSAFDLDGDGLLELIYADADRLWILDGATGEVLYSGGNHGSSTLHEYPVVADVDGDGTAEIVVAHGGEGSDFHGLTVLGERSGLWTSARRVWNQYAYHVTNVNEDLSIPQRPEAPWPDPNGWRQGAAGVLLPRAAADLLVLAWEPCQARCGDPVDLLVQVGNEGVAPSGPEQRLSVYCSTGTGDEFLLDALVLGAPIEAGVLGAPYVFSFDVGDLRGCEGLRVVVGSDPGVAECDEDDDEAWVDLAGICE
jgi:hypothetical protein